MAYLRRRNVLLFFIFLASVLTSVYIAFGADLIQKTFFLAVNNLGLSARDLQVSLTVPRNLELTDWDSAFNWDADRRVLSLTLDGLNSDANYNFSISIQGLEGRYTVRGSWVSDAGAFSGEIPPIVLILGNPIGGEIPVISDILEGIRQLRADPQVVETTQTVLLPISVSLSVVGAGALTTSAASAGFPLFFNILETFRYLGIGAFRIRRRKPWGKVYNEITKAPVSRAMVKILDAQFKRVREQQLSDSEGRFGFLPAPGEYYLKITHPGFADRETGLFRVASTERAIDMEITLAPRQDAPSPKKMRWLKFWAGFKKFIESLNPLILALGTLLSLFVAVIVPTPFNIVVFAVYLLMDVLKIIVAKKILRSFGRVLDSVSRRSLPLALVRVFDSKKNWLLGTKASDEDGRFNFLLVPGSYYVTCARTDYRPYHSEVIKVREPDILAFDLELTKK